MWAVRSRADAVVASRTERDRSRHAMPLILAGPVGDLDHAGGAAHPEHPGRVRSVIEGVSDLDRDVEITTVPVRPALREEVCRVHSPTYLDQLEAFCLRGGGDLDPDTYARTDSYSTALLAAGAGLAAIEELEARPDGVGFVAVRPPGHHAGADGAMGFCLLNNIAIAAASLVARGQRVLIIDWDVHHGNGTQDLFWNNGNVLFVSTHQSPLYPGTGAAGEVGGSAALGLTVNVPLPAGATGDVAREAIEVIAGPTIDGFAPDWVLVSCGFDAHRDDPLGGLSLSSGDFAELARLARSAAPAPGRLVLFLEGGYDARALRNSTVSTLGALLELDVDVEPRTSGGPGTQSIRSSVDARERVLQSGG
jgi:acetoin utilization deacetylase AcuC-like enzyme